MPYFMLISNDLSNDDLLLDYFLGSASVIEFYWESIGRELNLQLISNLTERADSEEGFVLSGNSLIAFRREMSLFRNYWNEYSGNKGIPINFLRNINVIIEKIDVAIDNGLILAVG